MRKDSYASIHAEKADDGRTWYRVNCFRCGQIAFTKKVVEAIKTKDNHFC